MEKLKETLTVWNGYKCIELSFEGRHALVVCPNASCEGNKWLLKTEYFGAFPEFELDMLARGYHLAYIENKTRWMVPDDVSVKARFADYLSEHYGLNKRCVPVGMSCGGLHAVYFAAEHPEYVAALYLDAPVMNLLSCPGAVGRTPNIAFEEFENDTGITLSKLLNYRNHPVDRMQELLEADIPVLLIAGDSDVVVPYSENGEHLAEFYKKNGGTITEIIKPGCNHHPHGLEDRTPMIEFVLKYYN